MYFTLGTKEVYANGVVRHGVFKEDKITVENKGVLQGLLKIIIKGLNRYLRRMKD